MHECLEFRMITANADKAAILNENFVNFGCIDNGVLPDLNNPVNVSCTNFESIYFEATFVGNCISWLKLNSAAGPDGLPILFKKLSAQLCHPLAILFNLLIQFGQVPDIWKTAIVVPIFKKGISSNPENYRPISLTCICSKFFEKGNKNYIMYRLSDLKYI
jgi:hypothetical protein